MEEIWKDIPDYEGVYLVSNTGKVLSLERLDGRGFLRKEKYLKPAMSKHGYAVIRLNKDGNQKHFLAHRLVLMAFVGKSKLCCDHINGVRSDNRLCNLEYVTHRENVSRGKLSAKKARRTSDCTGVCKPRDGKRYISRIRIGSRTKHIGSFATENDAHQAYLNELSKIEKGEI